MAALRMELLTRCSHPNKDLLTRHLPLIGRLAFRVARAGKVE